MSQVVKELWKSSNKKWSINLIVHPRTNKLCLEVTDGFMSQIPIFYDHGGFAFNNPELIPKYVMDEVRKKGNKLREQGLLYKQV